MINGNYYPPKLKIGDLVWYATSRPIQVKIIDIDKCWIWSQRSGGNFRDYACYYDIGPLDYPDKRHFVWRPTLKQLYKRWPYFAWPGHSLSLDDDIFLTKEACLKYISFLRTNYFDHKRWLEEERKCTKS